MEYLLPIGELGTAVHREGYSQINASVLFATSLALLLFSHPHPPIDLKEGTRSKHPACSTED